ncbi:MAG: hypothetical protein NT015_12480 [Alphaproteobacteria bacterium]|nr:hypothetical protein [Alphaproteobacteria bacterium]
MRAFIIAVFLSGCASSAPLREGETIADLTPSQLQTAYQGRSLCVVFPDDGACESVIRVESSTLRMRTTLTIGATDIAVFTTDPMAMVVRELPMFENFSALFGALEAQRASGGYRYVKQVEFDETAFDPATRLWCLAGTPSVLLFQTSRFYFSNDLSADISGDERLSPDNEAGLRAFLRAVITDRQFRSIVLARAREHSQEAEAERMFGMLDGSVENCASYSGVVASGRIDVTAMNAYLGDVSTPSLSRAMRSYPVNDPPQLRAN